MSILPQGEALLWVSLSVVPVLGSFQETLLFLLEIVIWGLRVSGFWNVTPEK